MTKSVESSNIEYYWNSVDPNILKNCNNYETCDSSDVRDCYVKEIFNNKINSKRLLNMVSTRTSSNGRFKDLSDVYRKHLLTTVNLGIGIIIVSSLIIKNS
jgi:hypothetical protein